MEQQTAQWAILPTTLKPMIGGCLGPLGGHPMLKSHRLFMEEIGVSLKNEGWQKSAANHGAAGTGGDTVEMGMEGEQARTPG